MPNPNAPKTDATPDRKDESLFSASIRVLGKPIRMICDPITQTCYPVLEDHWRERYRKPWPEKYARRMLILDMALLTLIATLVVTAMIYRLVTPLFTPPILVNLDVLAPKVVVSGAPVEYDVAYRNGSDRTLGCAVLRAHLPAGTVVTDALATTAEQRTFCPAPGQPAAQATIESDGPDGPTVLFPLGNVPPRGADLLRVHATTYGPTGARKTLAAEMLYWEEAETEPSRVNAKTDWNVDHAVLSLDALAPAGAGQRTVTFDYANATDAKIGPIALRVRVPDGFVVSGVTSPQSSDGTWTLGVLDAHARGTVGLTGRFRETRGPRPPSTFVLEAVAQVNGRDYPLETLRRDADPATTGFTVSQALVMPDRAALLPGEHVKVAVTYQNDGERTLRDATIRLVADPRFVAATSPAELVWDKASAPQLAEIPPGRGGTLTAEFDVVRDIAHDVLGADAAPIIRLSSVATFAASDAPDERLTVDSAETALPVATRIGVQAAGLYFTKDGDQLGVGPLPPRVGQTTKYRVFIDLTNTSGETDDVVVDAVLPPNVAWTGRYSVNAGQAIDWLPSERTVRWEAGAVPSYVDGLGEHLGASFEVALTPGKTDVGSVETLVSHIELRGHDKATGLSLLATAQPITTDLPFDTRAAGKGTVEK